MKLEIISQGGRELIVNMTILETWDETWASYLSTYFCCLKPGKLLNCLDFARHQIWFQHQSMNLPIFIRSFDATILTIICFISSKHSLYPYGGHRNASKRNYTVFLIQLRTIFYWIQDFTKTSWEGRKCKHKAWDLSFSKQIWLTN